MNADLERLIALQRVDTFAETARRRIAEHPALVQALDAKLSDANDDLASARQRLADSQAARRAVEKDLAMIQSRLSKYKDQLMEVKTNKEYQAMLKEIEVAQNEVRNLEDKILERMLEADDLAAGVKTAEARLATDKKAVEADRKALEEETTKLEAELASVAGERQAIVAALPPALLSTYDTLARGRKGLAVVEARAGLCTACHVRLRPQRYNELRSNQSIITCESCQRILYFSNENAGEQEPR